MLSPETVGNLDYLARLGVLNYDAAADISGHRPRFYGSPQGAIPPLDQSFDSFSYQSSPTSVTIAGRPAWKVMLTAALYAGGALLGGNILLKCCQSVKKGVSSISPKNWFSGGKKALDKAEKGLEKAADKLKDKKAWYKNATDKLSDIYDSCKKKFGGKKKFSFKGKKFNF